MILFGNTDQSKSYEAYTLHIWRPVFDGAMQWLKAGAELSYFWSNLTAAYYTF